jgi:hypothetical protein
MPISNDPSTWPSGDLVWSAAAAIAGAEGANVAGSVPDRFNNPGDLSKGDEHGQPVSGYQVLPDGENTIMFASKQAGWTALYTKLSNILTGSSSVYSPTMTWAQIAQIWAGNSQAWVNNVTRVLGVSPNDIFQNFFTGGNPATDVTLGPRRKPGHK